MLREDLGPPGEDVRGLDHPTQLAYVAGPRVPTEQFGYGDREVGRVAVVEVGDRLEEVLREQEYVVSSIREAR